MTGGTHRHRRIRFGLAVGLLAFATLGSTPGRADTVASLLGDFTINQFCKLDVATDAVRVHYAVVYGQLPALRELREADTNRDGVTTQVERDAHVARQTAEFARELIVTVDDVPVALRATHWTSSLPVEQGGFSLRVDVDFEGALTRTGEGHARSLALDNRNFQGRVGWAEIVVGAEAQIAVFNTNAYSNSLTGELTEALQSLPDNGPLSERAVRLSFIRGAPPAGASSLGPRPDSRPFPARGAAPASVAVGPTWVERQTRALVAAISARSVAPAVLALALAAALLLGAFHALSPGHGKTIVGAYLVGSHGTPWHAVFLGLTVTVTHTLGVFALGFGTLLASQFLAAERLVPALSVVSGLLVLGMGIVMLVQRLGAARHALNAARAAAAIAPSRAGVFVLTRGISPASARTHANILVHEPSSRGPHDPAHAVHAIHAGTVHSHGGVAHSHLPPGADGTAFSWGGLLALGVSGGLVPCPSALVLLLAAVAVNKTAYGILLVLSFSVGLAATLTVVGLAFLYARHRLRGRLGASRWPSLLPVLSAASITAVGAGLCVVAFRAAFLAP